MTEIGSLNEVKQMIKMFDSMAGKRSVYTIFNDWIKMLALSISCVVDPVTKKDRSEQYGAIASGYDAAELTKLAEISAYLVEALEACPSDILGYVYMHLEQGSKNLGQFFTPYHLCVLMAELAYNKIEKQDGRYTINEPSCGAGGNIIAILQCLKEHGINYQRECDIVCQDLDYRCVYMCYVQLSFLGAKALVVQGDTLQEPFDPVRTKRANIFITPGKAGALI